MASIWGGHWPNGDARDLGRLLGLGLDNWTVLDLQANVVPQLRAASPTGIVHVRFYTPKWSHEDPMAWAQKCGAKYRQDRGGWSLQSMGCAVSPANEQNLPDEGGGWTLDWYERINDWLLVWVQEFKRQTRIPDDLLFFPALAYGHNELEFGYDILARSIRQFGVFCDHPYWFKAAQVDTAYYGRRYELDHAQPAIKDKPIFCSELGGFEVMRRTFPQELVSWFEHAEQVPYILGGTPFILEDPTGAHHSNDMSRNPAIYEAIREHPKKHIDRRTSPMPDTQEQLRTYARWALARIDNDEDPLDRTAFEHHVRILGGAWKDLQAYGWPGVAGATSVDVQKIAEHADQIRSLVAPFL